MDQTTELLPVWLLVAQSIELFLLVMSIGLAILIQRAVLKHRLFHLHLRLLLTVMGMCWYLMTMFRIASIIEQYFFPEAALIPSIFLTRWLENGRISCAAMIPFISIMVIFERIVASALLETYSKRKYPALIVILILCVVPIPYVGTSYSVLSKYGFYMAFIAIVTSICVLTAFVIVDRWNRRKLYLSTTLGINYNLNQRMQLSENIRAASIIYACAIFGCCSSLVMMAIFICSLFVQSTTHVYILRLAFNLSACFFSIALILITVTRAHIWRVQFAHDVQSLLHKIFCPNRIRLLKQESIRTRIRSTDGVQLAFSLDEEKARHFNLLADAWNRSPGTLMTNEELKP